MKSSVCTATLVTCLVLVTGATGADAAIRGFDGKPVSAEHIDREAQRLMAEAKVQGLAMAVIDDGKVVFVRSWGRRNVEKKLPLQTDTIMYGASLTKFAFAYMVMHLVDEGKLDLDRSIARYLSKPLPEYPFYEALTGDERWRKLTPRILLSHTSGLANFAFLEPDQKMRLHWDQGPFGSAFFKGGHNDTTGNQAICVEQSRRCVLFLSNDVRAEHIYQRLTAATLGDPGMPWSWEGYTSHD